MPALVSKGSERDARMGSVMIPPSFAVEKSSSFYRPELSDSITGGVSRCRAIRSHRSANGPEAVFISTPTGSTEQSFSPLLPQFIQRHWRLWTIWKTPAPADGPLRLSRAPSAPSKLGRGPSTSLKIPALDLRRAIARGFCRHEPRLHSAAILCTSGEILGERTHRASTLDIELEFLESTPRKRGGTLLNARVPCVRSIRASALASNT